MADTKKYFREWYEKNRERIRLKRAKQYVEDPEYRRKAMEASRMHREKVRKSNPEGYTVPIVEAAEQIGVTQGRMREWRKRGYYPEPLTFQGKVWFTQAQVSLLYKLFVHFENYGLRTNKYTRDKLAALVDQIHSGWQQR